MVKHKPNDRTYIERPELLDKIQSATPIINADALKLYYHYLTERHKIYKKKEAGLPKPWTEDKILQSNSFTCDKRWLDKTSKWLISHIIKNPNLTYEDKVWRTIIFRLYNKIETAEMMELDSISFWDNIDRACNKIDNYPYDPYSRAYKIIAIKYAYRDVSKFGHERWKSSLLLHMYRLMLENKGQIPKALTESGESCMEWLHSHINGCGSFISYQIFVDLSYIPEFPLSDDWTVVAGPGCMAGIDMLCEDRDDLTYEEFLYWLRENIEDLFGSAVDSNYNSYELFDDLPEEERYWGLNDIENSFCEFSKLNYLIHGKHKRPRSYNGIQ